MPRINPYSLKRTEETEQERTFTENGHALTITLRKSRDFTRRLMAAEKASAYKQRYIVGEEFTGLDGESGLDVSTIRAVDGRVPAVSGRLCNIIALLETLEVPPDGEVPYTFEEWAAWGVLMPRTMEEIAVWAGEVSSETDDDLKNGSGEVQAL